jgi:hypothetical protein
MLHNATNEGQIVRKDNYQSSVPERIKFITEIIHVLICTLERRATREPRLTPAAVGNGRRRGEGGGRLGTGLMTDELHQLTTN